MSSVNSTSVIGVNVTAIIKLSTVIACKSFSFRLVSSSISRSLKKKKIKKNNKIPFVIFATCGYFSFFFVRALVTFLTKFSRMVASFYFLGHFLLFVCLSDRLFVSLLHVLAGYKFNWLVLRFLLQSIILLFFY